ncbi:XRE family transcriptional regulator [Lactobacillus taiwanensis]|uniref:Rgg family transcriptional regulator n=1 Tax=Lactobacillus taiwanensis TaxID=508451 RepID=UPI00272B53C3|nr:XRE family transcriptional regulator [Lactobacillus taiwanensis]
MFQLLIIQSLNETFIKISADELIAIRNKHHIDSSTFFTHFSSSQEKRDFIKEIGDAYKKKDKQELLTIKRNIDQLPDSRQKKYYQLQIDLVLNVYLTKAADIPADLKNDLKKFVFQDNSWNENSLQLFRETIRVYEIDELIFLVNAILVKYQKPAKLPIKTQEILGGICINFLDKCYEYNTPELIKQPLQSISKLSNKSELLLVKILKNYYQAVFNKNADEVKVISGVLEKAGWKDFVSVLPHLSN